MAVLKTQKNDASVNAFIASVEAKRIDDCKALIKIMSEITADQPSMWGENIIGFGRYHYKYESGREGDWFCTGFSPRKQHLTLYIMSGFQHYKELLRNLGKYKTGKSCLYINKLADVDIAVLKELIHQSVTLMRKKSNY